MSPTDFLNIARNTNTITLSQAYELENISHKFPYFQTARALHLKVLFSQGSYRYNKTLKNVASHIPNRTLLFDFITSEEFKKKIFLEKEKTLENKNKDETLLKIGKPIEFEEQDPHSFVQWLQITRYKPIERIKETTEETLKIITIENSEKQSYTEENNTNNNTRAKKFDLIDRFLETNPKIEAKKDFTPTLDLSARTQENTQELMTETLAKVYLEQGKFKEAIQAYQILILKNPEKSRYFASRISSIRNLQQKNNL